MHISTDEVFGSLGAKGKFDESSCYALTVHTQPLKLQVIILRLE